MESSRSRKIARVIAFIDEIWSAVDLMLTFVTFFGGEKANGLFYEVDHRAHLGDIDPEQVTAKKALTGLLLFISLLINLLWIFGAFMLFKGTEIKDCVPSSYQRELRCCNIWLYISIFLLFVHGLNLVIYVTESILEAALALVAFLARSVFIYFVNNFINELHEGPSSHQPTYLLYALPNNNGSVSENQDPEEAPFMATTVTQQRISNDGGAPQRPRLKSNTSVTSNGTHHRVILTPDVDDDEGAAVLHNGQNGKVPLSMSGISEELYELDIEDYNEGPAILTGDSSKTADGVSVLRSHPMTA